MGHKMGLGATRGGGKTKEKGDEQGFQENRSLTSRITERRPQGKTPDKKGTVKRETAQTHEKVLRGG